MLAIGSDNGVLWFQCLDHPDGDRFLAIIKMHEAADFLTLV